MIDINDLFNADDHRIWRVGKAKPGRKPKRHPRTRGENFQHWRMTHGVSAGDMVRCGVDHDTLALLFRFERGATNPASLQLIALAHAVLVSRDRSRLMSERDHAALSLAAALSESADMRSVAKAGAA